MYITTVGAVVEMEGCSLQPGLEFQFVSKHSYELRMSQKISAESETKT